MSQEDWEQITVLRKKAPKASQLKSEQAVNEARRKGVEVETKEKWGAAQNKHQQTTMNTAKLDQETEELKHDKVGLDVGRAIQQARQAKGWSQKELATRINEKQQIIGDYESSKAIPNQAIFGKLERALGVKLRGKDRGQPLNPPGMSKK